jgi:hypothetical protein
LEVEPRDAGTRIVVAVRRALRFFVCLTIASSIALAAVPAEVPVAQTEKKSCCAKMKMESAARECERHAPKSEQDQQCCALCALGCGLPATFATSFIYPPVGAETFAAYIPSEHTRSQPPPVPPPRVWFSSIALARSPRLRGEDEKETQLEDSHEILIGDRSGPGAGRHSERDFAFGWLLRRRKLLPDHQVRLLREVSAANS